jgi:hypothetical protein
MPNPPRLHVFEGQQYPDFDHHTLGVQFDMAIRPPALILSTLSLVLPFQYWTKPGPETCGVNLYHGISINIAINYFRLWV